MPARAGTLTAYLAGALAGRDEPWPGVEAARAFDAATAHGIETLLAHHAESLPAWSTFPETLRRALRLHAAKVAALEAARIDRLRAVLTALETAGLPYLVLKGTALAYTRYPVPEARPRNDTDLWIREDDREQVFEVLERTGHDRELAAGGAVAVKQWTFAPRKGAGTGRIDVHWALSNARWFADLLTFDAAWSRAGPAPLLGNRARVLGTGDALLHAAAHRAVHLNVARSGGGEPFAEGDRLLWLYDLALLATDLTPAGWEDFVAAAATGGARAVCLDGLDAARAHFPFDLPATVRRALAAPGPAEPAARYLELRGLARLPLELAALPRFGDRLRLLREVAFPPPAYMLARAGGAPRWQLPWLYLERAVNGVLRGLRRS